MEPAVTGRAKSAGDRKSRTLLVSAILSVSSVVTGSCSPADRSVTPAQSEEARTESILASLPDVVSRTRLVGTDVWEVAVCKIPDRYDPEVYDMSALRLDASAEKIVSDLAPVAAYFSRWSENRYSLVLRAATRDVEPAFGGPQQCVDEAIEQSSPDVDGVFVVADAQHREGTEGGWGRRGESCTAPCAVRMSRRAVYLGASDFVATSGSTPGTARVPLDLVEHELGHALGWPHSRRFVHYDSVIDVMSDSTAGRRKDPSRVDAPGVLAIDRYFSGWIDSPQVVVDIGSGSRITVDGGTFALVHLSQTRAISIEAIAATGDNAHLSDAGVAVHLIDWSADVCPNPDSAEGGEPKLCRESARSQVLIGPETSADGLMRSGERIDVDGVRISVVSIETRADGVTADIEVSAGDRG